MRRKGKISVVATSVALCLFILSGCGTGGRDAGVDSSDISQTQEFTDDLGRTVLVPKDVRRIVSLAPNLTEMVFAAGAGDRLVGVTSYCDFPEAARPIAKIGDTMNPNMESIVALRPDIVMVSTASQIEAFMRTLESNGIAVYVTNPLSFQDVTRNVIQLGEMFGTREKALAASDTLKLKASQVAERVGRDSKVRVFVQISKEPLFTVGKQSYLNELISMAGGESVTANVETAYPKLSKETASVLDPEAIILSESNDNLEPNEVFRNSPAVKNGRVYRINADILSRPGPRLADALEQIARALHPNRFLH